MVRCGPVQALGGHERQMGLLFATGLLITIPDAGWFIMAVLVIRLAARHRRRRRKDRAEDTFALVGAGLVAGSSVHDVTQVYRAL